MVTNVMETTTKQESEEKYEQLAVSALANIETKPAVKKQVTQFYESAVQDGQERRVVLVETIQLAAELSEALGHFLPEDEDLSEAWRQLASRLGNPDLTTATAKQEQMEQKLDIADLIEALDSASLVAGAKNPEEVKRVDSGAYEELAEALNEYTLESLKAIFKARDGAKAEANDLYNLGLGIEQLAARGWAVEMLAGFTEAQKDKKIEELTKKPTTAQIDAETIEKLYTGQMRGPHQNIMG